MKHVRLPAPPTRRHGWTLIETVMVVTATAVLSSVGVTVIAQLMQMKQAATVDLDRQHAVAQLARQLQDDGHLATDAELITSDDAPAQLRLTLPDDQTVTWSAEADTVTRLLSDSNGAVSRESFRAANCTARWTLSDDARLHSLHLSSGPPETAASGPVSIESFSSTITINVGRLRDLGNQLRPASSIRPDNAGEEE